MQSWARHKNRYREAMTRSVLCWHLEGTALQGGPTGSWKLAPDHSSVKLRRSNGPKPTRKASRARTILETLAACPPSRVQVGTASRQSHNRKEATAPTCLRETMTQLVSPPQQALMQASGPACSSPPAPTRRPLFIIQGPKTNKPPLGPILATRSSPCPGEGHSRHPPPPGGGGDGFASVCTFQMKESYLWATWFSRPQSPLPAWWGKLVAVLFFCFVLFFSKWSSEKHLPIPMHAPHPQCCTALRPISVYLQPSQDRKPGRQGHTVPMSEHPAGVSVHVSAFRYHPDSNTTDSSEKQGRLAPVGLKARGALVYGNRCWR